MMWPRLHLLRKLLTEDGAIFISIDDNEVHRLRAIMDEIFDAKEIFPNGNFVGQFIWAARIKKQLSAFFQFTRLHPVLPKKSQVLEMNRKLHGAFGNRGLMMSTRNIQNLNENTDKTLQRLRKNWQHGLKDYLMPIQLRVIRIIVMWITEVLIVPRVLLHQLAEKTGIR